MGPVRLRASPAQEAGFASSLQCSSLESGENNCTCTRFVGEIKSDSRTRLSESMKRGPRKVFNFEH